MENILNYLAGFSEVVVIVGTPIAYYFYKELVKLRKENSELKQKIAYYKGKYADKYEHKSHGKKR
jgi:hypothetical protein